MGESLKKAILSPEEHEKYGSFSPEQVARIIDASLLKDPENADAVGSFINEVHLKEQFVILLMKSIQPGTTAFYESISGICETRLKGSEEKRLMNDDEEISKRI